MSVPGHSGASNSGEGPTRRALRSEMRDHFDTILNQREELSKVGSGTELLKEVRDRTNAIFEKVHHNRERLMDAITVREMASTLNNQAIALDDMSRRCDFSTLCDSLTAKYRDAQEGDEFNWTHLGNDVGALFRGAVPMRFMFGPLNKLFKQRKTPAERRMASRDEVELERPDEIMDQRKRGRRGQGDAAADEGKKDEGLNAEATNERITHLLEHLQKASEVKADGRRNKVKLFEALVDPTDPVQTVENFFDFAFLVKDQRIMQNESNGLVQVMTVEAGNSTEEWANKSRKQMVLSMGMPDVKLMAALVAAEQALDNGADPDDIDLGALASLAGFGSSSSNAEGAGTDAMDGTTTCGSIVPNLTPANAAAAAAVGCALHRSDALYSMTDVTAQASMLLERENEKLYGIKQNGGSGSSNSTPLPTISKIQKQTLKRKSAESAKGKLAKKRVSSPRSDTDDEDFQ